MAAIVIGTIIFIIIFVVAGYFIQDYAHKQGETDKIKGEYRTMAIGLTFLAVFCMWLMWVSVYMHQMYPLIQPILDKEIVENMEHA